MKNKKLTILIFIIAGQFQFTFAQILQFEKKHETEANYITDLVETNDQSIVILGELLDSTWNDTSSYNSYFNHTLLYKVNLDGDILWSKTFYNYNKEIAWTEKILKTSDGNFILFGGGQKFIHLLKINSEGDSLWARSIVNPYYNSFQRPFNYLKVRQAIETCNYDILILSGDDQRVIGVNYGFSHLLKIDSAGGILWECNIPQMSAREMIINEDNNITLCVNKQTINQNYSYPGQLFFAPFFSIGLQTYNQNGNLINKTSLPFVEGRTSGLTMNNSGDLFISAQLINVPVSNGSHFVLHSMIMKINAQQNVTWTRDYIGIIQSIWPLANDNLLAVSWPNLKTINSIGDSVNGYKYNYLLKYSQEPLILISGNDLYQVGITDDDNKLMISKIDAGLIFNGDYSPPDGFSFSIDVYPNPASTYVNIDLTSIRQSDLVSNIFSDEINVFVYDYNGRMIKEIEHYFINNVLQLQLNNLANGLYFFKITLPEMDVLTEKIMVQN